MGPAVITAGRTVFGSLALLAAAKLTGSSLRVPKRRDVLVLAASGGLLAVHWFTFFRAIQVSTVAVGLLAYSTFPLFVTFLEPLIFRERLRPFDVLTAAVVVAGLTLVTPTFDVGNQVTQGVLWGVASGGSCALLALLSRACVRDLPALAVSFYQQGLCGLVRFARRVGLASRAPVGKGGASPAGSGRGFYGARAGPHPRQPASPPGADGQRDFRAGTRLRHRAGPYAFGRGAFGPDAAGRVADLRGGFSNHPRPPTPVAFMNRFVPGLPARSQPNRVVRLQGEGPSSFPYRPYGVLAHGFAGFRPTFVRGH